MIYYVFDVHLRAIDYIFYTCVADLADLYICSNLTVYTDILRNQVIDSVPLLQAGTRSSVLAVTIGIIDLPYEGRIRTSSTPSGACQRSQSGHRKGIPDDQSVPDVISRLQPYL